MVASLIDTWLLLRDIELGGERNRGLYVLKSRGMAHSNELHEFALTDHGLRMLHRTGEPDGRSNQYIPERVSRDAGV